MESCIIYGAGKWGKMAYWRYRKTHDILFYVDRNCGNYACGIYGKQVFLPDVLESYRDTNVIIAVESDYAIREFLENLGVKNIEKFTPDEEDYLEKIIIYGTGDWGNLAYEEYKNRADIVFFVDQNPEKQGFLFHEKMVYSPGIVSIYQDVPVLIAVEEDAGIADALKKYGGKSIHKFQMSSIVHDRNGIDSVEWENVPYLGVYDVICEFAKERNELPFDSGITRRFLGTNQYEFDLRRLQGLENMEFVKGCYAFFFQRLIDDASKNFWSEHEDIYLPAHEFQEKFMKIFLNSAEFKRLGHVKLYNNIYK